MLKAFDPEVSVLMIGAWEVFDRVVDGHTLRVGTPELERYLLSELDVAAGRLTAGGVPLILLSTPCFDEPDTDLAGMSAGRNDQSRADWLNRVWRSYADDHKSTVRFVDFGKIVCPGGEPRQTVDGKTFRYDGVHFTDAGAKYVWKWLAPHRHRERRRRTHDPRSGHAGRPSRPRRPPLPLPRRPPDRGRRPNACRRRPRPNGAGRGCARRSTLRWISLVPAQIELAW